MTYVDYWKKVIFVVSKWSYDRKAISVRKKANTSEESFKRDLYEKIESEFNVIVFPKVFYIDSFADISDPLQK